MTEHEMRIRLAEAMGWTDLGPVSPCIRPHCLWGTEPAGWFAPGSRARAGIIAPNPLESDRDAARLRAWCVGMGWDVSIHLRPTTAQEDGWHSVTITELTPCGGWREIGIGEGGPFDASDPLRRERLALCRAVVQALEAIEAGGEA